jgi:hypothetical protein
MIKGAFHNVLDYGAVGNGTTSDYAAFNLALAKGGTVFVPQGTYNLDGQVVMAQDNTVLFLDSGVTLLISNVPAVQSPVFGAHIAITGKSCSVIGSGPSSLIQAYAGTYSNAICFSGDYGAATVQNLTLDGDKNNTTAQTDDSFGAGIMTRGYITRTAGGILVDRCIVRNWNQYGFDLYNNTGRTTITNCIIHDNGVVAQTYSVGVGIINSAGNNQFIATNNIIFNNKSDGISSNSAYDAYDYLVANNSVYNNGGNGIVFTQQTNYGDVTGKGINNITVTGNTVTGNIANGIVFSTEKGYLKFITCSGNTCVSNGTYGIFAASTDASNRIENIAITGNVTYSNTTGGIAITSQVINWSNSGNIDNGVSQSISGTFSPAIAGTTVAGTPTYNVPVSGSYTKIGNRVFYTISLDWSAIAGGTGNLQITGLPYTASSAGPNSPAFVAANSITVTGQVYMAPIGGTTTALLLYNSNGTVGSLPIDTAGAISVSGSYATDI